MKNHKLFNLKFICLTLVFIFVLSLGVFAEPAKSNIIVMVKPGIPSSQNILGANFSCNYVGGNFIQGLRVSNLTGILNDCLDEGDVIMSAGQTALFGTNASAIWAGFDQEIKNAMLNNNGKLDMVVKDINTGNWVNVTVYIP